MIINWLKFIGSTKKFKDEYLIIKVSQKAQNMFGFFLEDICKYQYF